jgi:hypothetical protein
MIYKPVIQANENNINIPYYVSITGTDSVYDAIKDLDIMLDYAGYENLLTTYSSDFNTVMTALRTIMDLDNQSYIFTAHSLGCMYLNDIIYDLHTNAPNYSARIQAVYMFNPYVLATTKFHAVKTLCSNSNAIRDIIEVNIVDHDYASVLMRSSGYGNLNVYPNNIETDGNGFIDLLTSVVGGVITEISRQQYLNYTNHYLENWGTDRPYERIHIMEDLQFITIRSLRTGTDAREGYTNSPLFIKEKSVVNSKLLGAIPLVSGNIDLYNFNIALGDIRDYYYYDDYHGVQKMAFPYTITSNSYVDTIWFLHLTATPSNMYGLMTKDVNNVKQFNLVSNNLSFTSLLNVELNQLDETAYFALTQPSSVLRTKFQISGPLVSGEGHRRADEPNALDGNWKIINKRTSGYLLYTSQQYTIQEGHINTTHNLVGSNSNASSPDDSVWSISHNSGTTYYTFTNTQTTTGTAILLGDRWGASEYWRTSTNSIYGSQSDYKDEASNTISNNQIYIDLVNNYNGNPATTYGIYDVFLYVLLNGKRQYIVNYNDHSNDHIGWSYLFLVSEDHFNPANTNNIKDYRAPQDATASEKYNQFVWTLSPTGGGQIGVI